MMVVDNLLTIAELAERWKVQKSWIYKHTMEKGKDAIPRLYVGKYMRFVPEEVDDWLMKRQTNNK